MNTSTPSNVPAWISAAFTFVIAVATVFYVVYTRRLWAETKKSADAANASAEAAKENAEASRVAAEIAKKSADIALEMQQPMVEVSAMGFAKFPNAPAAFNPLSFGRLDLQVTLKNYGTLRAAKVAVDGRVYWGEEGDQLNALTADGPFQLAPGAEVTISFSVLVDQSRRGKGARYRVKLVIQYESPHRARRYRYTTKRALAESDLTFSAELNQTESLQ